MYLIIKGKQQVAQTLNKFYKFIILHQTKKMEFCLGELASQIIYLPG